MYKHILFCPGPVNVAKNVKDAITENEIGHREEEFSILLRSLNSKLLRLFHVSKKDYHPVIITGSGTAANEAMLSSIVGNKHILVVSNGEFGERLYDISKLHNKYTHHLKFDWAEKIDLKKLEQYLRMHTIDIIALVHHETSTGMINPIEKVGQLAKKYKKLFVIDTVSSAGAEDINLNKANVAFCTSSGGKALEALPGVSFVIGRKKEFENLKNNPPKTTYLNLYKFYHYATHQVQTPNTPAVHLFYALEQAVTNILEKGMKKRMQELKQRAMLLRSGMQQLGLTFLIDEKDMSCVLTTVVVPSHISAEEIKKKLKEKNIVIYNGKGPILNKVFQVGNIGTFAKKDMIFFLKELQAVLASFKKDGIVKKKVQRHTTPALTSHTAASEGVFPRLLQRLGVKSIN